MQKNICIKLFCLFILFSFFNLFAAQDSERLELLRQATGDESGGGSSFERRVDATFSPSEDPATLSVENQEFAAETQALNEQLAFQEQALISEKTSSKEGLRLKEKDATKVNTGLDETSRVKDLQVDASEKSYRKEVEEIENPKPKEENTEDQDVGAGSPRPVPGEETSPLQTGSLLANNPFYFGDNATDEATFQTQKVLLRARLIQQGMDAAVATDYVAASSSKEELLLHLMNDEGYTYGEARETVS